MSESAAKARLLETMPLWLMPLCLIALLLPLMSAPVLPLVDYYNHIARYWVLSHFDEYPELAAFYLPTWRLVPNLGLDLIGTALLAVVPPLLGAKILLAGVLTIQFTGSLALNRSLSARSPVVCALLTAGLFYSYVLNWGFANFLLATGLAFWAFAAWLTYRERPRVLVPVGLAAGILIFMSHAFAFMIYGVILAALEVARWHLAREGRARLARGLAMLASQAVAPIVLFLNSPTNGTGPGALPLEQIRNTFADQQLWTRFWSELGYRAETVVRVAESPWLWFDVLTFAVTTAMLVTGIARGHLSVRPVLRLPLVTALLLCMVVPPAMFGVGFVSDRLPYIFALLLAAGLDVRLGTAGASRIVAVCVALLVVRTGAITVGWSDYARDLAEFRTVMKQVPRGSTMAVIDASPRYRGHGEGPRCEPLAPLAVPFHGVGAPLFADKRMQPLSLTADLANAQPIAAAAHSWRRKRDKDLIASHVKEVLGKRAVDYLLLCGSDPITPHLPARNVLTSTRTMAIIKVR